MAGVARKRQPKLVSPLRFQLTHNSRYDGSLNHSLNKALKIELIESCLEIPSNHFLAKPHHTTTVYFLLRLCGPAVGATLFSSTSFDSKYLTRDTFSLNFAAISLVLISPSCARQSTIFSAKSALSSFVSLPVPLTASSNRSPSTSTSTSSFASFSHNIRISSESHPSFSRICLIPSAPYSRNNMIKVSSRRSNLRDAWDDSHSLLSVISTPWRDKTTTKESAVALKRGPPSERCSISRIIDRMPDP